MRSWSRSRPRPARDGDQLIIIVKRGASAALSANGHDAVIAHGCPVEPKSVNVRARPSAPGVADRVVDLRHDKRGQPSKQVEVVVKHGAARCFRGHRHVCTGCPRVMRNIVNVQGITSVTPSLPAATYTFPLMAPNPDTHDPCGIDASVLQLSAAMFIGIKRVYHATADIRGAASYVNDSIPKCGSHAT